jgi:hypothetical protein
MGLLQTVLIALIPLAFIAWRLRRMIGVLRGDGPSWKKIAIALVIGVGLIARVSRMVFAPDAEATQVDAAESVFEQRVAQADALIEKGEDALSRCDRPAADDAFNKLASLGIDMMNTDTTAGEPLFVQGLALAGLRDSANAKVLVAEAIRRDSEHSDEHTELLGRVTTLAAKTCPAN